MTRSREDILQNLADGVRNMKEYRTVEVAKEAVEAGLDAYDAIILGYGLCQSLEGIGEECPVPVTLREISNLKGEKSL